MSAWRWTVLTSCAVATFAVAVPIAGCGGDDQKSSDATALLEQAAAKPIQSARFKASAQVSVLPGLPILGRPFTVDVQGAAKANGPDVAPTMAATVEVNGRGQRYAVDVTTLPGNAYVKFLGASYQALAKPLAAKPAPAGKSAVSLSQLGLDPATWFTDPKLTKGVPIDGTPTQRVTGPVDAEHMVSDLVGLLDKPALAALLKPLGQAVQDADDRSKKVLDQLAASVQKATADVDVDESDYVRRIAGSLRFSLPKDAAPAGLQRGTISFVLLIEALNVDVSVVAPPHVAGSLSDFVGSVALLLGIDRSGGR